MGKRSWTPQIIKSSAYFINSPTLTQQRFSDFQFALSQLHQFSLKLWMELHRAAVWKQAAAHEIRGHRNDNSLWFTSNSDFIQKLPLVWSEKWSPIQNPYPKNIKKQGGVFFGNSVNTPKILKNSIHKHQHFLSICDVIEWPAGFTTLES